MIRQTSIVFGYELRRSLRSPAWVLFGVFQPILWLLLFMPVLRRLVPGEPLELFTPGVLTMTVLYGGLYTGFGLIALLRDGVIERLVVTPASRAALISAMVLRDGAAAGVQAVLLLGAAVLLGLRAAVPGVLAMLVLICLVTFAASAVSYATALALRDENGLAQTMGFFGVPLLLLSGIIVPFSLAPGWLRALGHANPFYWVVEAGRALFAGRYGDGAIPVAFVLTAGMTLLAIAWATSRMRRIAA